MCRVPTKSWDRQGAAVIGSVCFRSRKSNSISGMYRQQIVINCPAFISYYINVSLSLNPAYIHLAPVTPTLRQICRSVKLFRRFRVLLKDMGSSFQIALSSSARLLLPEGDAPYSSSSRCRPCLRLMPPVGLLAVFPRYFPAFHSQSPACAVPFRHLHANSEVPNIIIVELIVAFAAIPI